MVSEAEAFHAQSIQIDLHGMFKSRVIKFVQDFVSLQVKAPIATAGSERQIGLLSED